MFLSYRLYFKIAYILLHFILYDIHFLSPVIAASLSVDRLLPASITICRSHSLCPFVTLSLLIDLSACLSIHMSICLSICLFVLQSLPLYVCLPFCVSLDLLSFSFLAVIGRILVRLKTFLRILPRIPPSQRPLHSTFLLPPAIHSTMELPDYLNVQGTRQRVSHYACNAISPTPSNSEVYLY